MIKEDLNVIKELCSEHLMTGDTGSIRVHRLGGLTNKNYKVVVGRDTYVIRLPGEGTDELINRRDEHICTRLANHIGIDSKLIYFKDENGIKITQYIENAETMNKKSVKNIENMQAIAEIFKKLHTCGETIPVRFNVFEKIEEYENLLKKYSINFLWEDYEEIKKQVYDLGKEIDEMKIRLTMCHNDPLCENFVKGTDRMYLVDWEYAGMNDPMWDLADIFIEAEFTSEEETLFNSFYFGQEPDEQIKRRILINKVFLDFLWSLWGKQRYSCGVDLIEYANDRYARTKKHLKLLTIA